MVLGNFTQCDFRFVDCRSCGPDQAELFYKSNHFLPRMAFLSLEPVSSGSYMYTYKGTGIGVQEIGCLTLSFRPFGGQTQPG